MADELELDIAMSLARRLKTIIGLTWDDDAVIAHAQLLMRWCKGAIVDGHSVWPAEAQAEWLVMTALETWEKWHGTAALHQLFRSKFDPAPPPSNAAHDLGKKPPVECRTCNDSGVVGEPGKKRYCTCNMGLGLEYDNDLGQKWLQLINGRRELTVVRPAAREDAPLTAERIAAMKAEEQLVVDRAIESAEAILGDPQATKEQKKTARRLLKIYLPKKEAAS